MKNNEEISIAIADCTVWSHCNMPKYYEYFEQWFDNLTSNQIDYFTAYMKGKKTPNNG